MTAATAVGGAGDPAALVPGDPDSVAHIATAFRTRGDTLHRVAAGLDRVDAADGWTGAAADAFRSALDAEPARWREAGDAFLRAAAALERYRDVLVWAQQQAADAVGLWQEGLAATAAGAGGAPEDPGRDPGRTADDVLGAAVEQLRMVGDEAARIIGQLRDLAPTVRRWPDEVTSSAAGWVVASAGNVGRSIGDAAGWVGDAVGAAGGRLGSAVGDATGSLRDTVLDGVSAVSAAVSGSGDTSGASAPGPGASSMPWDDPVVRGKIPAEWGDGRPNNSGVGHRWADPIKPERAGIRIDKGNPNVSLPTQQRDHIIVRDGGKVIGRDGRPIRGAIEQYPEDAHIPLDEWKQWKSWNQP